MHHVYVIAELEAEIPILYDKMDNDMQSQGITQRIQIVAMMMLLLSNPHSIICDINIVKDVKIKSK